MMPSVENSDTEEAHIEYRSIKTGESEWTVFCLDDREPEWWRVIAVFSSEKRAESYAEIEMMMIEENGPEEIGAIADGVHGHVPNSVQPQSSIVRSNFVRRESIEHIHIDREETVTVASRAVPEIQYASPSRPEIIEQEEPEEATSDPADDIALVDPSTLSPLTKKQAAIYNGLVDAIKEEGDEKGWVSYSSIERRAQATGATAHLEAMAKKGWVVNRGQFGAPLWTPLTYGKAAVDAPRDSAGRVIRSWTDAELDALKACAETTADYETFGQAVDRNATACEQKARTMGWYRSQGPGRWPQKDEESPAPIPADDFEVDVDDLSKGPREILSIIAELYADKVHPIKEPEILTLSEADEGRLAFILNRLRELRCVQRDGVGSYFPTARGLELAKQIKDEEEDGE